MNIVPPSPTVSALGLCLTLLSTPAAAGLAEAAAVVDHAGPPPSVRAAAALHQAKMLTGSMVAGSPATLPEIVATAHALLDRPHRPSRTAQRPQAPAAVAGAIFAAARATGVPASYLWRTARRESGLRPAVAGRGSTALGLYQFVESTWLELVRRHGARHGLGRPNLARAELRQQVLALRVDPRISSLMAAELARENSSLLRRAFGAAPSEGDLYAAHFLGPASAVRLIRAARNAPALPAAAILPTAAAANPSVFYRQGRPVSCASLLEALRHG